MSMHPLFFSCDEQHYTSLQCILVSSATGSFFHCLLFVLENLKADHSHFIKTPLALTVTSIAWMVLGQSQHRAISSTKELEPEGFLNSSALSAVQQCQRALISVGYV